MPILTNCWAPTRPWARRTWSGSRARPLFGNSLVYDPDRPRLSISAEGATKPEGGDKFYVGRYVYFTLHLDGYDQLEGAPEITWTSSQPSIIRLISNEGGSAVFQTNMYAAADVTISAKIRNYYPISTSCTPTMCRARWRWRATATCCVRPRRPPIPRSWRRRSAPPTPRPTPSPGRPPTRRSPRCQANGAYCYVTGHKVGEVTITASLPTGLSHSVNLKVTEPVQKITITTDNAYNEVGYLGRLYFDVTVEPATALQTVKMGTVGSLYRYAGVYYDAEREQWYATGLGYTGTYPITVRALAQDGSNVYADVSIYSIIAVTAINAPEAIHTFVGRTQAVSAGRAAHQRHPSRLYGGIGRGPARRSCASTRITRSPASRPARPRMTVTEPHSGVSATIPISVTVPVSSVEITSDDTSVEIGKDVRAHGHDLGPRGEEQPGYGEVIWSIPSNYARYATVSADGVIHRPARGQGAGLRRGAGRLRRARI